MNAGKPDKPEPPVILSGYLGFITNRLGVHPWGQVLILALLAGFYATYHSVDKITDRLHDIDIKLAVMPLDISKDLLSQAQTDVKLGRYDRATRATETATSIIAKASTNKIPASSDYFTETIGALDSMAAAVSANDAFSNTVHSTRLILADYRSSLEALPAPRGEKTKTFESTVEAAEVTRTEGATLNFLGPANMPIFDFTGSRDMHIRNWNILSPNGSYQILGDGVQWENVVFVGAHIKYQDGDIDLKYVRFVNCTFEVMATPRGRQFIDYVVLAQNKLTIPVTH